MIRETDSENELDLIGKGRYIIIIKEFDGKPCLGNGHSKNPLSEVVYTFSSNQLKRPLGAVLNKLVSPNRFESCKDLMNLVNNRFRKVSYFDTLETVLQGQKCATLYLQNEAYSSEAETSGFVTCGRLNYFGRDLQLIIALIILIFLSIACIAFLCLSMP